MSAEEIRLALEAAKLLAPLVQDVVGYLRGDGSHKPARLLALPAELQSEIELARLKERAGKP